jgi:hypothetical protein
MLGPGSRNSMNRTQSLRGGIGIGGAVACSPSHTTRHAGPHRAVREVGVYPVLLM